MRNLFCGVGLLAVCWCGLAQAQEFTSLADRSQAVLAALDADALIVTSAEERSLDSLSLHLQQCRNYPYSETASGVHGSRILIADLRQGLETGMRCLSGDGPMGRLHSYHEYQAHRLLLLFEARQAKTVKCVEDAMFATAVATGPRGSSIEDPLYRQLRTVEHPAIVIDTYRLGGVLSRQFDDETYRSFFHLADSQIIEHRHGQPLRPANLHRYKNRSGLLFHEVIHWLGHEHSALYPDLAHLYETCCFAGSDYIGDARRNREHQETACDILRDDELWSSSHRPYRQMRLWHLKGYDAFKGRMRADYDL